MKRSQSCPKCAGRKIWVIERYRVPSETAQGAELPLVVHQGPTGTFTTRLNPVGHLDAYVCAACGYAELYADDFHALREDPAKGVRLLDATTAPAGPFR